MSGQKLGQHFLASDGHRRRIVDALQLRGGETVLEVGPGKGAITDLLAEKAGKLYAIELDPMLADALKARYAGNPAVEIIEGDILQVALPMATHVIGNLPYYITSPIFLRLFQQRNQFQRIVAMVQREVAERITAQPGSRDYSFLSVTVNYFSVPKMLFKIPPGAFVPPPRVESAVVSMQITPRHLDEASESGFFRMVRAAFSQKRKTLPNNLKASYGVERAKEAILAAGLPLTKRAEELPLDSFLKLWEKLKSDTKLSPV